MDDDTKSLELPLDAVTQALLTCLGRTASNGHARIVCSVHKISRPPQTYWRLLRRAEALLLSRVILMGAMALRAFNVSVVAMRDECAVPEIRTKVIVSYLLAKT